LGNSEEELKPKRGSKEQIYLFFWAWVVKTLKPNLKRVNGMRGALNQ
jgi:hypothetical protein